jgi:uncharacterized protein (DUF433 family)
MSTSTLPADLPTRGLDQLIAVRPGYCGGKPHITGHRIKVQDVAVWHERLGQSPEEIVATYPTVDLAQVYAALAYYHAHRPEIDADIRADEELVTRLRSAAGQSPLERKLRERHVEDDPLPPG